MKKTMLAFATLAAGTGSAYAGALDRSMTPVDILFHEGNYAEVSLGYVNPSLDGKDNLGAKTGSVAKTFTNLGGGIKTDIGDYVSAAVIFDQPYGVDVKYPGKSSLLGETRAKASSRALTFLMRYKFNDNFSLYGGPRVLRIENARVNLYGNAYGRGNGYEVEFGDDTAVGAVGGVAYERPDLAMRVSLTYHTQTKVSFSSAETFRNPGIPGLPGRLSLGPSKSTSVKLPQSVRLDFQSGVAKDTLVFGSVRWADWSKTHIVPEKLGSDLANLNDSWSFELGAGRKFTDRFAGSLAFGYEPKAGDDLVSPLAPSNGNYSVTLGGRYNVTDQITLSGGVRYTWLIDAKPAVKGREFADFKNNHAISYGMKIGYNF